MPGRSASAVNGSTETNMKTLPHARLALLLAAILLPPLSAGAVTFTNNTAITFDNSNYDGADIVVTNCTLIVDGAHTFASLHILNGGTVTHSFSPTGVLLDLFPVSGELHVLTGTNSESLNYSNAVVSSILVTDGTGQIIYAPITDYVAGVDLERRRLYPTHGRIGNPRWRNRASKLLRASPARTDRTEPQHRR